MKKKASQYHYWREKSILSHRSFAREWNQTLVFAGFLRESRRREILHRPRLRLFILNLPRRGGNRGTSLPCNFRSFSPLSFHHPLHPVAAPYAPLFSPLPTLVATACSNTPVRHPPLFTTSKRRRCFFPLRCSKNFIRSLFSPGSAWFMKFGDDLKLLRRVREFSSVLSIIRVAN